MLFKCSISYHIRLYQISDTFLSCFYVNMLYNVLTRAIKQKQSEPRCEKTRFLHMGS